MSRLGDDYNEKNVEANGDVLRWYDHENSSLILSNKFKTSEKDNNMSTEVHSLSTWVHWEVLYIVIRGTKNGRGQILLLHWRFLTMGPKWDPLSRSTRHLFSHGCNGCTH